jgi:predicted permease
MSLLRNLAGGLRGLIRKQQVEREMDEELQGFLDAAVNEKMRRGMSRDEALRAARIEMGGAESVKEQVWAVSWESLVETLWQDLKFGLRLLRFNTGFAAAAVLSLALGIGANTAIFQLLDAVRLRTLPVKNPQELARVAIDHRKTASGSFTSRYSDLTFAMWEQIRAQQQGFSNIFAWGPTQFNISPAGEVHNVQGLWVSGAFFQTLGVEPALGRLLTPSDDQPGCGYAGAVLSYSYWQQEYGGQRDVIGRKLTISRQPFPIIGVAAPGFYGVEVGRSFDVAVPLCAETVIDGEGSHLKSRISWWLSVMGRLKPGWNVERAGAQLQAVSPGLFQATLPPEFNVSNTKHFLQYTLGVSPARSGISDLREQYEDPLWLLQALAGLVLLMASANLANLLLARASAREKEMAMRMAVGASRSRLMRQLLAESLTLAMLGAAFGALLARNVSLVLVASLSTQHDPLFVDMGMDWRVLGFTTALAVLTCILFGLAPALRATNVAPSAVLKESGRGSTQGRSLFGLRRVLVSSQIALSLTLLVGALLFARSLNNLAALDPGFRRDGILVADIDFTMRDLPKEGRLGFSDELLRRVRALPGVDTAALAAIVPLSGNGIGHDVLIGDTGEPEGEAPVAAFNHVSPGFFETLQTTLLAGRDFDDHDRAGAPNVAVVSETFVKKFASGNNHPLGMTFRVRRMNRISAPYQIIGVVKDTKYIELREELWPIVYTAIAQDDDPGTDAQILIRSRASLASILSAIKSMVSSSDPDTDISFSNFHQMIDDGLLRDHLMARLSGFFGVLAAVLAAIGLYGVISYTVERRRNEIGIRMALGANQHKIIRLVLRETGLLLLIGLAAGVALALATARTAASMLFALKPTDTLTYLLAALSLSAVAAVASFLPARRAARLDPMVALRNE